MEKKNYVIPQMEVVKMQLGMVICGTSSMPEPAPGRKDLF